MCILIRKEKNDLKYIYRLFFQKLFKTLHGLTNVDTIKIFGISLPVSVLDIMFKQSSNIEYFGLLNVGLGNEGLLRLSSFVREKSSVKSLCIGGDLIDDMSIASSLSPYS